MNFGEAIAAVVQSIVLPYGYTLSIWSAGILAAFRYGAPKRVDPLLFVVGAVIGFMVFNIPTYWAISGQEELDVQVPTVALLNIVPLAAVVVSTFLTRLVKSELWGYFLSGFSATVVYVGSLSLLIWALG